MNHSSTTVARALVLNLKKKTPGGAFKANSRTPNARAPPSLQGGVGGPWHARAFVSAKASNSQGMAAFMKKISTELGAAVPELASQGTQGQLMSPPGSKSCQRSV